MEAARQLFLQGASVPLGNQHPPLYEAWSRLEAEAGDSGRAEELLAQALALGASKKEDRADTSRGAAVMSLHRRKQGGSSPPR